MLPNTDILRKLEPYIVPAIVVLVVVGAFGFGRLSALQGQHTTLRIIYPGAQVATPAGALPQSPVPSAAAGQGSGPYVASKTGTKYYLASCSGASRIKDENRIYFASAKDAADAGYGPASNCPGL